MEQRTSPLPRISVSSQDRPTRSANANWPRRLFTTACYRPCGNGPHMVARLDPDFAFRFNEWSLSCCVSPDGDRLPSHGLESKVCPTLSFTLRPCLSSSQQHCLIDAARLVPHLPIGSVGILIQCVMIVTTPSPLVKSEPHLLIPHNPTTTGNTSADMHSMFRRMSGTPTKSSGTSFGGGDIIWNTTSERHVSISLYEIGPCRRPLVAGDLCFHKPCCCRRVHSGTRILAVQDFPHLAMHREEHGAKRNLAFTT